MSRTPRHVQWTQEACYHLMDRGHNRETVFVDDADRVSFLNLVARYRDRFGFRLFHYCLMSNHFHLLLQLQEARQLSQLMAGLLRAYVHYFHRRHGFVGHLWQGRFKSPAIQCRTYLLSCGRYIERNSVEAGLVERAWDYRWSSAAAHAHGKVDPLLCPSGEYLELSALPEGRQERWREFLQEEDPREEAIRSADWAIGDEAFRARILRERGRPGPRRRGRPRKAASGGAICP